MPRIDSGRKAIVIMQAPPSQPTAPDAELVAINALRFLAGRHEDLGHFLAVSGVNPADLRRLAGDPAFLGGILDFLLGNESLLLAFAADAGLPAEAVVRARRQLDLGRPPLESSES
jgi:hypothetical protein